MINNNIKKEKLLVVFVTTIAIIFSDPLLVNSINGQENSNNLTSNTSNFSIVSPAGFYMIQLIKSEGFAPTEETFTFNIIDHELIHVSDNIIQKKVLNETEITRLNDAMIPNINIIDFNKCPDCKQYGLSYGFVESEKRLHFSGFNIWSDGTKAEGVKELNNLANIITEISQANGNNKNGSSIM
jgi:hypothetical protein